MKKKYLSFIPMLALVGCGTSSGGVNTHVVVPTNGTVVSQEEKANYALSLAEGIGYIGSNSFVASSEIILSADVSETMEGKSVKAKIDLKAQTIVTVDYLTIGIFGEYVIPSVSIYLNVESFAIDYSATGQQINAKLENLIVSATVDAENEHFYLNLGGYGAEDFAASINLGGEQIETEMVQALINENIGDGLFYLDLSDMFSKSEEPITEPVNIFEQIFQMAGLIFAEIVQEDNFDIYRYQDGGVAASIDLKGEVEEGVNVQAGLMVLVNKEEGIGAYLEEVKSNIYVTANVNEEGMSISSNILANIDCGFQYDQDIVTALMLTDDEKLEFTTDLADLISAIE